MPEFDFKNPPFDHIALVNEMIELCQKNNGYGLSANQCGVRARVFVVGANDEYVAFFNPKLIGYSGETHMSEGCLSFPLLALSITRPTNIEVEYQDYDGNTKYMKLGGISARCFLHELDHMNGILYTERAKPMALQSGKKKREKILKNVMKHGNKFKEAYTYR
jgi:peptide deformylase